MKSKYLFIIIIILGNNSLLFTQETDFLTFEHRALSLKIEYPAKWEKYWYYDDYSEKNLYDLRHNEIKEMVTKYRYYPIFYIKKYDEIYNGINPSIKITLMPNYFECLSLIELIMASYDIVFNTDNKYKFTDSLLENLDKDRLYKEHFIEALSDKNFIDITDMEKEKIIKSKIFKTGESEIYECKLTEHKKAFNKAVAEQLFNKLNINYDFSNHSNILFFMDC